MCTCLYVGYKAKELGGLLWTYLCPLFPFLSFLFGMFRRGLLQ